MKSAVFIALWIIPVAAWAELSDPIRVVDEDLPHAAPIIDDVDGDGVRDLLVGLYRSDPYSGARVRWFRNSGSNASPQYATGAWLQAGGMDASVDEVCYTGAGPRLVDFDGDGIPDLVSGGRDGLLNVFAGLGDGVFDDASIVSYATARSLREFRYNARVVLYDCDQDGDQDVLAARRKTIWMVPNEGSPGHPVFGDPRELVKFQQGQESFSSADVADWDQDGKADLVVGLWDGSVVWYRNESDQANESRARADMFGTANQLVGPGLPRTVPMDRDGNFVRPDRPAGHVRVSVVDYDQDGKVDLLLGDAWAALRSSNDRVKLSDEQVAQRREAYAREVSLRRELKGLQEAPEDEKESDRLSRLERSSAVRAECVAVWQIGQSSVSHARHGSVWLFRRLDR